MSDDQVVFWGLSGVLIDAADTASAAILAAGSALAGRNLDATAPGADDTDLSAVRNLLRANGIGSDELDELMARARPALVDAMRSRRDELVVASRTAGSAETMARLRLRGVQTMTLLTGWIEENATLAVSAIGVDRYLDLEVGGYGSDTETRAELLAVAVEKIRAKYGAQPDNAVLITHSTVDTEAARQLGMRVVGVSATAGGSGELLAAGAAAVFADLSEIPAVVAAIHG